METIEADLITFPDCRLYEVLALKSRSIEPTKLRSASEALSDTLMDNPFVNLFAEIEYIPEFELYVRVSPDDVKISKPDGTFLSLLKHFLSSLASKLN